MEFIGVWKVEGRDEKLKNNKMESQSNSNGLKLEPHQERIYVGLKSIGEEISTFYLDALKTLNNRDVLTKSYLVSHLAREIDGGLRDIFCITDIEKEKCKECGQEIKKGSHFEEICIALGVGKEDKLANKWHRVAKQFYKYAHRRGAWNVPRDISKIENIWKEFETVLLKLVGSYYNLLERIDRILEVGKPSKSLLNTLPNILEVDSRYHYLFRNLKSVEWFKPLYQRGYFSAENLYKKSIATSEYLENIVGNEDNFSTYEKELNIIINDVIAYRKNKNEGVYTSYIDASIVKIAVRFLPKKLNPEINDFIEIGLNEYGDYSPLSLAVKEKFIPYLLKEQSNDHFNGFLSILLKYEYQSNEFGDKFKPMLNEHQLKEIFDHFKLKMIEVYPQIVFEVSLSKVKDVLLHDSGAFNIVWIPTIENHSQITFPDRYVCQIIQLLRDVTVKLNPSYLYPTIDEWLNGDIEILKRLASYTISVQYVKYKEIFWQLKNNPFDYLYWEHELYEFLKNNCMKFNNKEITKLINWIETEDYSAFDDDEPKLKEEQIAYQKKKWLSALEKSQNSTVKAKIKYYNEINPAELKNPGFLIWSGGFEWVDDSKTLENFDKKSAEEIIKELNSINYKTESEELDRRELSIGFEHYVGKNPSKFISNLEKFHNLQQRFKDDLISGLLMSWRDGKDLNWEKVLNFIYKEIFNDGFWRTKFTGNLNYRNSFIKASCELISAGTANDQRAFDEEYINIAKDILVKINSGIEDDFYMIDNIATGYLNSTKGRFYDALLNLSLRYARLHKDDKIRWLPEMREIVSSRLNREQDKTPEFSILVGGFLPNFLFLDGKWVKENINLIFKEDDLEQWQYTMEGHLFFDRTYYQDNYLLLRKNGHIRRALEYGFEDREINNKLCGYILLAYFSGIEKIEEESEIHRLLNGKDEYLRETVRFIQNEKGNPNITGDKVKPIWKHIYNKLSNNLDSPENQTTLAESTEFLYFFSDIDEEIEEIITKASKYLHKVFVSVYLVEQLKRLVQSCPLKVGRLYLRILKGNHYPDYKKEDIINIVETLYREKEKDLADQICNLYAEKGYLFLRDVYTRNQGL